MLYTTCLWLIYFIPRSWFFIFLEALCCCLHIWREVTSSSPYWLTSGEKHPLWAMLGIVTSLLWGRLPHTSCGERWSAGALSGSCRAWLAVSRCFPWGPAQWSILWFLLGLLTQFLLRLPDCLSAFSRPSAHPQGRVRGEVAGGCLPCWLFRPGRSSLVLNCHLGGGATWEQSGCFSHPPKYTQYLIFFFHPALCWHPLLDSGPPTKAFWSVGGHPNWFSLGEGSRNLLFHYFDVAPLPCDISSWKL